MSGRLIEPSDPGNRRANLLSYGEELPDVRARETPLGCEILCGNSSIEILAKRLPVANGPTVIEVVPILLGDFGLIENEAGSGAARS